MRARHYEEYPYFFEDAPYTEDFYDKGEIEALLEDDEISSEEEGFMLGYMES